MALEKPKDTGKRRDGNSTRLIDYYVQLLFTKEIIIINSDNPIGIAHDKDLFNRIVKRLSNEHKWIFHNKLKINKSKLTISWL